MLDRYYKTTNPFTGTRKVEPWTLEIQGQRLKLIRPQPYEHKRCPGKRKSIGVFTRQARFRMLKMVASVEWQSIGNSLFITLTYPDEVAHVDHKKRNRERYLFLRYIENYLGKEVAALWRVEYVPHQNGRR